MRINKKGPGIPPQGQTAQTKNLETPGQDAAKANPEANLDVEKYTACKMDITRALRRAIQKGQRGGKEKINRGELRTVLAEAGIDSTNLSPEEMKAIVDSLGSATAFLDEGALKFTNTLRDAYYADMLVDPTFAEYNRRAREALAQDIKSFNEFLITEDKTADKLSYEDFRKLLKNDRIETSEWQSMMIWLTTGVKKSKVTS